MNSHLSIVKERLRKACERSGRSLRDVSLIAVSKTWPTENVKKVISEGHTTFGENKVQELEVKYRELPHNIEWHFIGRLQRNKVRKVLQYSPWIHSVDSVKLLEAIARISGEEGKQTNLFIQVNVDAEQSKNGFSPSAGLDDAIQLASSLENINLAGLMCIPMPRNDVTEIRDNFKSFRELRDSLEHSTGVPLPYLSMGMSKDFEIAIEESATHVRVGSAIFGKRTYSQP